MIAGTLRKNVYKNQLFVPKNKPPPTFQRSGKLRASSSEILSTTKSLKRNHGLVGSAPLSASGTTTSMSDRDLGLITSDTLYNGYQMRGFALGFDLNNNCLDHKFGQKKEIFLDESTYPENVRCYFRIVCTFNLTMKVDLWLKKCFTPVVLPELPCFVIIDIGINN